MTEIHNIIKIILIGETNVGKSSILNKYCDVTSDEISTIGVDFKIKTIIQHNKTIKLHIWDTAGQERYNAIILPYFRNIHGILLVFDLTNKISFIKIKKWIDIVGKITTSDYKIILVGNKCDDINNRQISEIEINNFLKEYNLIYFETSAINNINIDKIFNNLVINILDSDIKTENRKHSIIIKTLPNKNNCCNIL